MMWHVCPKDDRFRMLNYLPWGGFFFSFNAAFFTVLLPMPDSCCLGLAV
jgi:hypothetical protein